MVDKPLQLRLYHITFDIAGSCAQYQPALVKMASAEEGFEKQAHIPVMFINVFKFTGQPLVYVSKLCKDALHISTVALCIRKQRFKKTLDFDILCNLALQPPEKKFIYHIRNDNVVLNVGNK